MHCPEHEWTVCGDLKVLCMLLGQQAGYTKMPCFLCKWHSRARDLHWVRKQWPPRESLTPGSKNIIHEKLIELNKVLLPPLHIKLGLMKQFVKALPKNGDCFKYICNKFPALSYQKVKEGVFVGSQIRKLILDTNSEEAMNDTEKDAWVAFRNVLQNLRNNKDPD